MPDQKAIALDGGMDKATMAFIALLIVSMSAAVVLENPLPLILPIAVIGLGLIAWSHKLIYYLFFFLLPFSVEVELPGGFSTDLPSEPLMLVLSYVALLLIAKNIRGFKTGLFLHPISLLVLLHLIWIGFTSIYSSNPFFSMKFFLAKTWYLLPFYFLPLLLDGEKDFRKLFRLFLIGLFISVAYVMLRHAGLGFSFDSINKAVRPIYRNHVNYGILLIACLPYYVYLMYAAKEKASVKGLGGLLFLLLAIYLTYTRAAHISVVLALGVFFVIKFRLAKPAIMLSVLAMMALSVYLVQDNQYLDMAPDYNKAVEHKKFDNLVEATYKMEDISTVERFYRWIAGVNMVRERPLLGFGPACFYSEYRSYTVTSYKTYVSNNPEKSGIHNYYLMTAVEQGLPGLLIFLAIAILPVLYAEQAYHRLKERADKALLMAAVVSHVCILAVLIINDLLEADKVGPVFFLSVSIIVYMSHKALRGNGLRKAQ